MNFFEAFKAASPALLIGLRTTVQIAVISIILAIVVGVISCLMSISKFKPFAWIAKFYIWLIRGTPLLVQGFFIFYAFPQLMQTFIPSFRVNLYTACLTAFTANAGAYISEIFRGGIQAVPKGQMEAARSLGLSKGKAMIKVILPQAFKISIPSLVNQCIITLKDTSILCALGLKDMVYHAKNIVSLGGNSPLAIWSIVAIFYLAVVTVLSLLSSFLERRLSYAKGTNKKSA